MFEKSQAKQDGLCTSMHLNSFRKENHPSCIVITLQVYVSNIHRKKSWNLGGGGKQDGLKILGKEDGKENQPPLPGSSNHMQLKAKYTQKEKLEFGLHSSQGWNFARNHHKNIYVPFLLLWLVT